MDKLILLMLSLVYLTSRGVDGHGRLVDPPSRSSAWRYGFDTPVNYDDNQLFCGGKSLQWEQYGGRCGVCGDPYPGPRQHEAGGRYATGTIVRSYSTAQTINVEVQLTANHKGWFEFRLCPNNNPSRRVTQSCLDTHVLPLADGSGTKLPISSDMFDVTARLRLPTGLTCTQCVLQWKYNTGNSWGVHAETGRACVGCGPQEQFYACADISIGSRNVNKQQQPNQRPRPTPRQRRPQRPRIERWNDPNRRTGGSTLRRCVAVGPWRAQASITQWCQTNCELGNCPSSHCSCS